VLLKQTNIIAKELEWKNPVVGEMSIFVISLKMKIYLITRI